MSEQEIEEVKLALSMDWAEPSGDLKAARKERDEYKDSVFQYGIECTKLTLERDELANYVERLRDSIHSIRLIGDNLVGTITFESTPPLFDVVKEAPSTSLAEHDKRVRDEVIDECAELAFYDRHVKLSDKIRALKSKS